jgi:hypothetical protein
MYTPEIGETVHDGDQLVVVTGFWRGYVSVRSIPNGGQYKALPSSIRPIAAAVDVDECPTQCPLCGETSRHCHCE